MSFASKLRSNWRVDDDSAIGGYLDGSNIVAGSFLPAAAGGLGGASNPGGGFLLGSFASQLSGAGFVAFSAQGVISGFYGTVPGVNGSGWKFIPFVFQDISTDGTTSNTVGVEYFLSTTGALATLDSVIVVGVKKFSQTFGSAASAAPTVFTLASNISVHFMFAGWIVSAVA